MVKRYYGTAPYNSRVKVEYVGRKPKVAFEFPNKNLQVRGSMLISLRFFSFILLLFVLLPHQSLNVYLSQQDPMHAPRIMIMLMVAFLAHWYIVPAVMFFPFRKHWDKVFPKYMAWKAKLFDEQKEMVFTPKKIGENLVAEVPLFSNILLDYKATGDTSKQLEKIIIEEHKFRYYKKRKRKRQGINEWMWYAKFYFKKKPKGGRLVVKFI